MDTAVAFICALLSSVGVGGGNLFIIYLTLIKDLDQQSAQALNMIFYISASAVSLLFHIYKRRINKSALSVAWLPCILGCITGSITALSVNADKLRIYFGIFMILAGGYSLINNIIQCSKNK